MLLLLLVNAMYVPAPAEIFAARHRVIDDFFEPEVVGRLQTAAIELHRFVASGGEDAVDFQWMPIAGVAEPRNLMEAAVASVVDANVQGGLVDPALLAGVSWWVNVHKPHEEKTGLDSFHFDSDMIAQSLLGDTAAMVTPLLSTVTYLTDGGGPTIICEDYDVDARLVEDSVPRDLLLSFPRANKHLAFDSMFYHGFIEPLPEPTQNVSWRDALQIGAAAKKMQRKKRSAHNKNKSKKESRSSYAEQQQDLGVRITLAVNFWDYQENVAKIASPHYAEAAGSKQRGDLAALGLDMPLDAIPAALRNPAAASTEEDVLNLSAAAHASATIDSEWTERRLRQLQAYLKPRVPNRMVLALPHRLLQVSDQWSDRSYDLPQ